MRGSRNQEEEELEEDSGTAALWHCSKRGAEIWQHLFCFEYISHLLCFFVNFRSIQNVMNKLAGVGGHEAELDFPKMPANLKGQCHEIFCFWFFSWISFPQAPEYTIRAVSNFFENSRRYLQLKVDHRYQRHRRQILPPVSEVLLIPVANCHRYQWHWQLTPVANNEINIRP